ncbi:MAG: hypothetical protein ISR64_00650 [Deltaproteobacteria bacterium]|nr:hypothetical protein [Deltaproteobacteria bacterium]
MTRAGLYAGWILVDVRLFAFLALLCTGITILLLGLLVRRRAWHEYVTLFVSVASILFGVGFLLLQTVFDYPILVERDFFLLK